MGARSGQLEPLSGTARDDLSPSRMVHVVVGDRATVEPGIRVLELGEPRIIDADGTPLRALTAVT